MSNPGNDNILRDPDGHRLGRSFRAAAALSLRRAFLATARPDGPDARQALAQFERAARRFHVAERAFRERSRDADAAPSLLTHLRSAAQMQALRSFHAAKDALFDANPAIAEGVVRLAFVEPALATAPARPAPGRGPRPVL